MKRAQRLFNAVGTGAGTPVSPDAFHGSQYWPALQHACVPLAVRIPLPALRLREVQALKVGTTIQSDWAATEEVPLFAAGIALSWCEFEGAEQTMAVRLTRLG